MADQRGKTKKRKVSKFSQSPVARKVLLTSSASKRFRSEEDRGEHEEAIKDEIGASSVESDAEVIDRLVGEHFNELQAVEDWSAAHLLSTVEPQYRDRVIRRYRAERRQEQLRRVEAEDAAPETPLPGSGTPTKGSLSPYGQEDQYAKRVRHELSKTFNKAPLDKYLARGGVTRQHLGDDSGLTRVRITAPLDEQILGPTERQAQRRVAKGSLRTTAQAIAQAVLNGDVNLDDVLNHFSEESEAQLRPRIEKEFRDRGLDIKGYTIDRLERELPGEQVVWDSKERNKATQLAHNAAQLEALDRRLKEEQEKALRQKMFVVKKDEETGKVTRRIIGETQDIKPGMGKVVEPPLRPPGELGQLPLFRLSAAKKPKGTEADFKVLVPRNKKELDAQRKKRREEEEKGRAPLRDETYPIMEAAPRGVGHTQMAPGEAKRAYVPHEEPRPTPPQGEQLSLFKMKKRPRPPGEPPQVAGLTQLRQKIAADLEATKSELSLLKPNAMVGDKLQTPAETERIVRKQLDQALTIPDPLGRLREGVYSVAADQEGNYQWNRPLKKKPATDEEQEAFIKASVDSFHAPSHAQRFAAAQTADRLSARMAQRTQQVMSRREEIAAHNRLIDSLRREGVIPPAEPTSGLPSSTKNALDYMQMQEKAYGRVPSPSELSKRLGISHDEARAHLKILHARGILRKADVKVENPKTKKIETKQRLTVKQQVRTPTDLQDLKQSRQSREGWMLTDKGWEKRPPPTPPIGPPPTGGAQPPFGGANFPPEPHPSDRHPDPRLNDLTVEDLYEAYKHERPAPRLAWERDRLRAKLEGRVIPRDVLDDLGGRLADPSISAEEKEVIRRRLAVAFTDRKPKPFENIPQQGRFLKDRIKARVKGFKEGTEILGFDENAQPIAFPGRTSRTVLGTTPKARLGVMPNVLYEYKLRNPQIDSPEALRRQDILDDLVKEQKKLLDKQALAAETEGKQGVVSTQRLKELSESIPAQTKKVNELRGPITRQLPPTDLRTQFHEGRRDTWGRLLPGEWDERVAPVERLRQQDEMLRTRFGDRQLKNRYKETLPPNVEEIRYIATPGGKGKTRTEDHPEGKEKTIYLVAPREGGRRGREVEVTREEYEQHEADINTARQAGRIEPVFVRQETIPRKIQYKFVDPKDLELKTSQRDIVTLRLPKLGPLNERLVPLQFSADENSIWNKYPGRGLQSYGQIQKLEAAQQIADAPGTAPPGMLERYGIRDKTEAKMIMEAAAAAGFYTELNRFRKGRIPFGINRQLDRLKDKHPSIQNRVGDVRLAVNEAYARPALERVSDVPFMVTHPFSSRTGQAMGIDFASIRHRQELIGPDKMVSRALAREAARVKRVQDTKDWVAAHKTKPGPVGAFTRWRLSALQRMPDYQLDASGPTGILGEAMEHAREVSGAGEFSYIRNLTGKETTLRDLSPRTQLQAEDLMKQYEKAEHADKLRYEATVRDKLDRAMHPEKFSAARPNFLKRAAANPGLERNLLIGGAAVGTVAGAAYLYHRHQESKKPEEERVAWYNKALPPKFNTPRVFPQMRVTSTRTLGTTRLGQNLGFDPKKHHIPTQVGVSFHSKTVASRPMDRPDVLGSTYAPNLPIFGKPSLRTTPGGSARKGLTYYGQQVSRSTRGGEKVTRMSGDVSKRTNVRRSTHELRILGKKIPGALNIQQPQRIRLSPTNPNRPSQDDIENLIYAHLDRPEEEAVKNFYRGMGGRTAGNILETWESPDDVARIRRTKERGTPQYRQYQRSAVQERRRVYPAGR